MNAQTTDRTISNFIRALRNADIRVSTAETLDALSAVELVGYDDRDYLKRTLSLVLPKTADEKVTFDACFDQFFAFQDVRGEEEDVLSGGDDAEDQDSEEGGDGEGGGAG
ncbi:MAG TPA: VWA containing CoxE family protein, partial [Gammaproteobacteria bacterium]|nr:VWA containing CoxE family protein [Gammaproteobacteria bacterium]